MSSATPSGPSSSSANPTELEEIQPERTFVDAYIDRYDTMENDLEFARAHNIIFLVQGNSPRRMPNGRVSASFSLSLDDYGIRKLGCLDYIKETCERVTTLTLARNKIDDWNVVFELVQCMPALRQLDLTANELGAALEIRPDESVTNLRFNSLSYLCLNSMDLTTFRPIETILTGLPNISELSLSKNLLNKVDLTDRFVHEKLEILNLCGNSIDSDVQIVRIGQAFPNLRELILAMNPVSSIAGINQDVCHNHFSKIQKLSFNNTLIDDWRSVEALKRFPSILSVYLRCVPLSAQVQPNILTSIIAVYLGAGSTVNGCLMNEKDIEHHKRELRAFFNNEKRIQSCPILDLINYDHP